MVHLDTDIAGNPDDARALVMLLGWPGVDLLAVTTTHDPGGRRAGCAEVVAAIAGRPGLPVVAGAAHPLRSAAHREAANPGRVPRPPRLALTDTDARYWPHRPVARPSAPGAATERLAESIAAGACVVALGPLTNLAALELAHPGALGDAHVVVCGGWPAAPPAALPAPWPAPWLAPWPAPPAPWPAPPQRADPDVAAPDPTPARSLGPMDLADPARDTNIRADTGAARIVVAAAGLVTFVPLPHVAAARLRVSDVAWLRGTVGPPLGSLLAAQAEAWAWDTGLRIPPGTPAGTANARDGSAGPPSPLEGAGGDPSLGFQFDPVTAAVAAGWDGAEFDGAVTVTVRRGDGGLCLTPRDPSSYGAPRHPAVAAGAVRPIRSQATRVVTAIDPARFAAAWRSAVLATTR